MVCSYASWATRLGHRVGTMGRAYEWTGFRLGRLYNHKSAKHLPYISMLPSVQGWLT